MYYYFIDTETTGLNPEKHGLVQIAGIILKPADDKLIEVERFDFHIKPLPGDIIDQRALQVSGITVEYLKSDACMTAAEAKHKLETILGRYVDKYNPKDKLLLLGYNVVFDADFMRAWFVKQQDKFFGSWFWYPPVCVMNLAAERIGEGRSQLENFKLGTVIKHFGITHEHMQLHDALDDIELTVELYLKIRTGSI